MKSSAILSACLALALSAPALAQDAPPPTPTPAPQEPAPPVPDATPAGQTAEAADVAEKPAYRPLEGTVIINLPSVEVPSAGTLTLLFTHRFGTPVQDADWFHDLLSFDLAADIGIGLAYAPLPNLDVSVYRSSAIELDPWEFAAKYRLISKGPIGLSLRMGGDVRSEEGLTDRWSFFAQAILALSICDRFRITAVPTYVSQISGRPFAYFPPNTVPPPNDRSCQPTEFGSFLCHGLYENVFNVPVAVSFALTRSISIHGEFTARYGKADSIGVGWIASIEKTLLRHRFAFTVGNQQQTTVDQYTAPLPWWMQYDPAGPDGVAQGNRGIYLGFNIVRQWKLK